MDTAPQESASVSPVGWTPLLLASLIVQPTYADPTLERLSRLSLQDLSGVEVTSVSKAPQAWRDAPATIFVISHDDIVRSGATSLPEALRLAPNLLITQLSSSNYVISARGFGGNPAAQNFSNKLLMLIDGRSVYTPLFSGIYTDAQDVVMEDIERIEVISGPGATLWGANAENGVINVITRPSYLTSDSLVSLRAGSQEQGMSVRYGGRMGDGLTFRAYAKGNRWGATELIDSSSAQDGWWKGQMGFRADWTLGQDAVTVQGDIYRGTQDQLGAGDILLLGGNVLARWQRRSDRSELQAQVYVDQTERSAPNDGVAFVLHTYDVQIQQNISVGSHHEFVWGFGERINSYGITNSASLLFVPDTRSLTLANLFAHDTISFGKGGKLALGIKLENDPYSGWEQLPDARLSWSFGERGFVWAAASRAIRSPTPFDQDVVEKVGGVVFLTGNQNFRPERVSAYEVGYRGGFRDRVSTSVSLFYNVYDNLRSIEPASNTQFLPLRWDNLIEGHTYGIEGSISWEASDAVRLTPSIAVLRKQLRFKSGASGLLGIEQSGLDPDSHASLTASVDLGYRATFDAAIRYVDGQSASSLPSYCELNARLGWRATKELELSITGRNLFHPQHLEFDPSASNEIVRSVLAEARWKF